MVQLEVRECLKVYSQSQAPAVQTAGCPGNRSLRNCASMSLPTAERAAAEATADGFPMRHLLALSQAIAQAIAQALFQDAPPAIGS